MYLIVKLPKLSGVSNKIIPLNNQIKYDKCPNQGYLNTGDNILRSGLAEISNL